MIIDIYSDYCLYQTAAGPLTEAYASLPFVK